MGLFGGKKSSSSAADQQDGNDDIVSLDDNALDQAASGAGGATVVVPIYSRTYEEDDDGIQYSNSYNDDDAEEQKEFSCFRRFKSEFNPCSPWFSVSDKATGRTLDIPESFAPASCYAFVWKLACTAIAILTLAWQFVGDIAYFVLAYFTNWGVTFVCIYFILNTLNTVCASRTLQPTSKNASVGCRIRITWLMYAIGVHSTAGATFFYWVFLFDPSDPDWTFTNLSAHGGLLLLMIIDGMFVNRIPLRWQHWYVVLLINIAYVGWTLIHAFLLDVGNPYNEDNDPETNDDAIYDVVVWKDDWKAALTYSCINCFVLSPLLYLVLWCLTNGVCWDRRKLVESVDDQDQRPTVDDVQEGSVFAKWR